MQISYDLLSFKCTAV